MPLRLSRFPAEAITATSRYSPSSSPVTSERRWSVWGLRLLAVGVLVALYPLAGRALASPEGREMTVMSALGAAVAVALFLLWAYDAARRQSQFRSQIMWALVTTGASLVTLGAFLLGASFRFRFTTLTLTLTRKGTLSPVLCWRPVKWRRLRRFGLRVR